MESKLSRALAPKRPDAPTLTSRQLVKAWWQALRPPFFIVDLIPVAWGGAGGPGSRVLALGDFRGCDGGVFLPAYGRQHSQ